MSKKDASNILAVHFITNFEMAAQDLGNKNPKQLNNVQKQFLINWQILKKWIGIEDGERFSSKHHERAILLLRSYWVQAKAPERKQTAVFKMFKKNAISNGWETVKLDDRLIDICHQMTVVKSNSKQEKSFSWNIFILWSPLLFYLSKGHLSGSELELFGESYSNVSAILAFNLIYLFSLYFVSPWLEILMSVVAGKGKELLANAILITISVLVFYAFEDSSLQTLLFPLALNWIFYVFLNLKSLKR